MAITIVDILALNNPIVNDFANGSFTLDNFIQVNFAFG